MILIIVVLRVLVFSNLGQKKEGDLSAYSVFNKGFTTLLGQSTGQQFDKEIRHNNYDDEEDDDKDNLGAEIRVGEIKGMEGFIIIHHVVTFPLERNKIEI